MASPTAVQLEWRPPREEEINGVIQAYIVNITDLQTDTVWQQRIEDDIDTLVESLHPFYSYSLSIAAETVALGPFTVPVTVEMPEDGKYLDTWHINETPDIFSHLQLHQVLQHHCLSVESQQLVSPSRGAIHLRQTGMVLSDTSW